MLIILLFRLFKEPSILLVNSDKNIQTDLHPIPSHIDPNYVWNIWDYYRQACHLVRSNFIL